MATRGVREDLQAMPIERLHGAGAPYPLSIVINDRTHEEAHVDAAKPMHVAFA